MTPQELAKSYIEFFVQDIRTNGITFYKTENPPEELDDLIQDAHGDEWPDDWIYETVLNFLYEIADSDDLDDARDGIEADIYTSDRLEWFSSKMSRSDYVDEYYENFGAPDKLIPSR